MPDNDTCPTTFKHSDNILQDYTAVKFELQCCFSLVFPNFANNRMFWEIFVNFSQSFAQFTF